MFRSLPLILLLILLVATSGCRLPGTDPELPDDGPAPVVSEAAARQLIERAVAAGQVARQSGTLILTMSDDEVTSLLAIPEAQFNRILAEQPAGSELPQEFNLPLAEPQVYFKADGTIVIRGRLQAVGRSQPARIVAAPRAREGELVLDFVEGRLGPLPLPESLFDPIGRLVAAGILAGQSVAEITVIEVTEGEMVIGGRRN